MSDVLDLKDFDVSFGDTTASSDDDNDDCELVTFELLLLLELDGTTNLPFWSSLVSLKEEERKTLYIVCL